MKYSILKVKFIAEYYSCFKVGKSEIYETTTSPPTPSIPKTNKQTNKPYYNIKKDSC